MHYFIKAYITSGWCSKSLNIGGTNLTQVNFGNIAGEIKLIDTRKFYQKSFADLASTLPDEKIAAVKKVTEKLLNEHYYFPTICPPGMRRRSDVSLWSHLGSDVADHIETSPRRRY